MARTKMPNVGEEVPTDKNAPKKRSSAQVRIEEPVETQKRSARIKMTARRQTVIGKGKEKAHPSLMDKKQRDSDSETKFDSFESEMIRRATAESKRAHLQKRQKSGNTSSAPTDFPEFNLPFLDGNLDEGVNMLKYNKHFREKKFCLVVSVDLQAIKIDPEMRLDLTDILGRFESWLKIDEEYCSAVVRRFYCNMEARKQYSDVEFLVPTKFLVSTSLKGRKIEITKELINRILGLPSEASEPPLPLTVAEAQRILLQKDQAEPIMKFFRPSKMCDKYRIIHYIVSRNIINKYYSFTYLSQEDCVMLARIIRGDKLDIGEFIFNLMKDFSSAKWQTEALIPIPQVVSLLLKKLNIAHLQGEEKKKIDSFDPTHLKRMKLDLPYDPSRSMLPLSEKKKKKEGSSEAEGQDGAQSFAVELDTRFDLLLASMRSEVQASQQRILDGLKSELIDLKNSILDSQTRMQQEIDDIKNLVVTYITRTYGPSISEQDLDAPTPVHSPPTTAVQPSFPIPEAIPDPVPEPSPEPVPEATPKIIPEPSSSDFSSVPTPEASPQHSPKPYSHPVT